MHINRAGFEKNFPLMWDASMKYKHGIKPGDTPDESPTNVAIGNFTPGRETDLFQQLRSGLQQRVQQNFADGTPNTDIPKPRFSQSELDQMNNQGRPSPVRVNRDHNGQNQRVIRRESVTTRSILKELKSTLQSHDTLNPKLWNGEKLDPEVWQALNKISKEWAKFANIPNKAIKDVIVVGGNANYNYTKYSDIDLHLMLDKSQVKCDGLVDDYLLSKKQLWALTHDITVKGQPVELYGQSAEDTFKKGQGVYSLKSNGWLQQPERVKFDANSQAVKDKVYDLERAIMDLINSKSDDIATFKRMKGRLKGMRSTAIEKGGEYAPENLAFKELRNRGVLDKMNMYLRNLEDKDLSL